MVGAVWVRNIHGYGDLDDETPEFAISLYKEYRGYGIGTELMRQMLELFTLCVCIKNAALNRSLTKKRNSLCNTASEIPHYKKDCT